MLQNKIYQNFIKEIFKTFVVILFGLSVIAWTVRAVNFLDLIVENGYSVTTYFQYAFLNLFGIMTKFIPLAFLISLTLFIIKQIRSNEFIILWTSGVKKLKVINLFLVISLFVLSIYIIFSAFVAPYALNKSRLLLSKDGFNSFLPTIRVQQFSDSFKGFTFIVDKKFKNEIKNVFIHDESNTLKNLTSESSSDRSTTIVAKEGMVEEKKMLLFDGQIIFTDKNKFQNNIIKFQQLNVDLGDLKTATIKDPKLQETLTINLVECILGSTNKDMLNCKEHTKNEIVTVLNRRLVLPLYIPIIALISSLLLIKTQSKRNYFFNIYSIFIYGFLILLYAELIIRYTGISKLIGYLFLISPIVLIPIIYAYLIFKLSRESFVK
tara:strand:- start:4680 stop:5816 length:1137 start_codon:yes stop_codon:yes gene_type:complete